MTTGYNVVDSCVLFISFLSFFFLVLFASLLETFAVISLSSSVAFFSSFFFPFAFYSLITLLFFFLFLDGKQRADSGSNDSGPLFFFFLKRPLHSVSRPNVIFTPFVLVYSNSLFLVSLLAKPNNI